MLPFAPPRAARSPYGPPYGLILPIQSPRGSV